MKIPGTLRWIQPRINEPNSCSTRARWTATSPTSSSSGGSGHSCATKFESIRCPVRLLEQRRTDDIPDEIWGTNMEAVYTWCRGFDTLAGFDFKYRWGRDGDNSIFPDFRGLSRIPSITVFTDASGGVRLAMSNSKAGSSTAICSLREGLEMTGNSQFGKEVSPAWSVALPLTSTESLCAAATPKAFRRQPSMNSTFPGSEIRI